VPQGLWALLLILLVVGGLWSRAELRPFNEFDQPFYLGSAYDLRHSGRFTDGYFLARPGPDRLRPSSMRFAPLYPGLLAAVAQVDSALRANIDCLAEGDGHNPACGRAAPVMRSLQAAELVCVFWLFWWIGGAVGGTRLRAWLTLGLALLTAGVLMRSVTYLMTEMTTLWFTTAATACGLRAAQAGGSRAWGFACGVLLALAALTRPAFEYLIFATAIAGFLAAWRARRGFGAALALVAGAALTLAPWILRNAIMFGRPALSFGYASHTLVQRIEFDFMTWHEYALSYVCWLPNGESLGRRIDGPAACERFGWDSPRSFYILGHGHLLDATLVASGGYAHHMSYLLHTYIFAMPLWHIAVTIPLALRGAYIDHWWGFVLLFVALAATVRAMLRGDWRFLLVSLPAWFMLALNAAVAVNQTRYNLMLILPYALAGAWVVEGALVRKQFFFEKKNQKTFAPTLGDEQPPSVGAKVFASFFKKKRFLTSPVYLLNPVSEKPKSPSRTASSAHASPVPDARRQ